jgi:hypothetical protein
MKWIVFSDGIKPIEMITINNLITTKFILLFNISFSLRILFKESEIISDQHYLTSTQTINDYFKDKSKKKALRVYQQSQSLNNDQIDPGEYFTFLDNQIIFRSLL